MTLRQLRNSSPARAGANSAASGLTAVLADMSNAAGLGYVGVEGIEIVPFKRFPGGDLDTTEAEFNTALIKIRAAVEHAIAHLKTWRMLSEEGGRTVHQYKNIKACSKPSSAYSSPRPVNKPPGLKVIRDQSGGRPSENANVSPCAAVHSA